MEMNLRGKENEGFFISSTYRGGNITGVLTDVIQSLVVVVVIVVVVVVIVVVVVGRWPGRKALIGANLTI
jgi:hypothetical protein